MRIIKDIYCGVIDMRDSACAGEPYRAALREALTPERVKLLDAAKERGSRLNDAANAEIFEQGFRLGAAFMLGGIISIAASRADIFPACFLSGKFRSESTAGTGSARSITLLASRFS